MVRDYNTWIKANLLGVPQIIQTKKRLANPAETKEKATEMHTGEDAHR